LIGEDLIELEGVVGRCSSTAAAEIARQLAAGRSPQARLHRMLASEGVLVDGTATRWELGFDLVDTMSELDVVVTFTWDEARRAYGSGVASLSDRPFPPAGSELERMLVGRVVSQRRLKGIWRQHLADRPHLPDRIPDAGEALSALREQGRRLGTVRRLVAKVSRSGGPEWNITDETGEHRVQWRDDGDRVRMVI
jgi:hypothetical protein